MPGTIRTPGHLTAAERRALGAHYTPPDVAAELVAWAIDGWDGAAARPWRALDPACGAGAFLLAVREVAPDAGLVGLDVDPTAVEACRAAVPGAVVHVADGLSPEPEGPGRFDLVVGNPPFLGQLARATARAAAARQRLRDRFGAVATGYVDTAALFLLAALDAVRPGGRIVLIQPDSVLGAAHTGPLRAEVEARAELLGIRPLPARTFTAAVDTCAVLLERRPEGHDDGRTAPAAVTWSPHLARALGVPEVRFEAAAGTVADLATATAGFRQHHYALAAHVVEHEPGPDGLAPVATTGMVDPGRLAWGDRPARIGGRRLARPAVDLAAVADDDPGVAAWFRSRQRPKVLVAPQTRVVEAAPDPGGTVLPATPLVSVEPHDRAAASVWLLVAALSAPPVTAWALHLTVGTARSRAALKLSARQALAAPLPLDRSAWHRAAARLAEGAPVTAVAADLTVAHGLAAADPVLGWWRARIGS